MLQRAGRDDGELHRDDRAGRSRRPRPSVKPRPGQRQRNRPAVKLKPAQQPKSRLAARLRRGRQKRLHGRLPKSRLAAKPRLALLLRSEHGSLKNRLAVKPKHGRQKRLHGRLPKSRLAARPRHGLLPKNKPDGPKLVYVNSKQSYVAYEVVDRYVTGCHFSDIGFVSVGLCFVFR